MYTLDDLKLDLEMLENSNDNEEHIIINKIRNNINNSSPELLLDFYSIIPDNLIKFFKDMFPFC